jgi:hypothetical protein
MVHSQTHCNAAIWPGGTASGRFIPRPIQEFLMEQHDSPELRVDGSLPRPVVLNLEDLAGVAAAGASLALSPALGARILIAGGFPTGPIMAAAF